MMCALTMLTFGGNWDDTSSGDEALVAAAQRGNAEAFASLHRRYYGRIYRLAYLKTNNAADAEDVAGETFLRALSHLPRFRFSDLPSGRRSLYPWLHRIALNLIADGGRGRVAGVILSLDAETGQGLRALLADAGESPHQIAERHEVQQMVRDAVAALPPDYGDVLIYRFLGDLSLREIAPLLHRSESAAKSLLHRAVVALRAELGRRLDGTCDRTSVESYARKEEPDAGTIIVAGRRNGA